MDYGKGIPDLLSYFHFNASYPGRKIWRGGTAGYLKLSILKQARDDVELNQARNEVGCGEEGKVEVILTHPAGASG